MLVAVELGRLVMDDWLGADGCWALFGKTGPDDVVTIAGSCIRPDGNWFGCLAAGYGSQTCKSSMSLPRKIMYSNTSSRGGTGRSVGRSSVPNERTLANATVDSLVSMVYKIPS